MKQFFLFLFLILSYTAFGIEVDRQELEQNINRDVQFENYTGPHETVDTLPEIRGIGAYLGQRLPAPAESVSYFDRYRIIHAVDPSTANGLDADILLILGNARVDHIDNIRAILASYLSSAYGYSSADAATLAEFVTIYNAIQRGNLPFFLEKYKSAVTQYLTADKAGIALSYTEWPGKTQLVVPLSAGAAPGKISAVDTMQLTDQDVIDRMRLQEDMGIESRKSMVDIMERSVEEKQQEIQQQQQQIQKEKQQIEQQQQEVQQQLQDAEEHQQTQKQQQQESQLQQQQQNLQQREQAVQQEEQQVEKKQQEVQQMSQEARDQREQIAQDTRQQMGQEQPQAAVTPAAAAPVTFIRVREQGGRPLGQLVRVDPNTLEVRSTSPVDTITSRRVERLGGELLVIASQGNQSRLMLIDPQTLETQLVGSDEIYAESILVVRPGENRLYAVMKFGNDWHLARFDANLELTDRSSVPVNPFTNLEFAGNKVFVQGRDNSVIALRSEDMREAARQ